MLSPSRKFLLITFLAVLLFPPSLSSEPPSAYDMLERFNFPKGILPEGAKNYTLNPDGDFEVFLSGDCQFRVNGDGYLLDYRKRITGNVKSGQLKKLNGVRVKILLVWFEIDQVMSSGTDLHFYVGPLSASFPFSNFEECPKCQCGASCASNKVTSAVSPALVSDS